MEWSVEGGAGSVLRSSWGCEVKCVCWKMRDLNWEVVAVIIGVRNGWEMSGQNCIGDEGYLLVWNGDA